MRRTQRLTPCRKVGHVLFNPAAENILASSSGDYTVKLWDLEDGQPRLTLKHNDMVQSLSWSADGNMLCTTSRDKKLRFWDVRQEKPAHEVAGHSGAKSSRVVWLGDHDRVATTGFSKMSDRQLGLWDPRNPSKPIGGDFTYLDSQSGICMPFWDDGSQMLYLAGKGDGNIRYFEYDNDKFEPLSEHKSPEPQRGLAFMPKRGVNTHANEVMRAYKTVNDQYIEPISFVVPRRAEMFQDDIYPPATGSKPAMSSAEWLDGKSARPAKIDMGDMYDGTAPKEYAAADAPTVAPAKTMAAPTPAPVAVEPKAEEQPQPAAAPREIPSMKDNQQSMSDMANKFAAKDAEESSDEEPSSPFEEISKPTQRPTSIIAARQEEKVGVRTPPMQQQQERSLPTPTASAPAPEPSRVPSASQTVNESPAAAASSSATPSTEQQSSAEPTSSITRSASSAAGGLKEVLGEIRGLLQAQGRQIEALTNEVAELKMKLR
jgi:coronin-1B/1C/6